MRAKACKMHVIYMLIIFTQDMGKIFNQFFLYFRIFDIFSKYMKNKIGILENDIFPIINIALICYQMTNVIIFSIIKKNVMNFFYYFLFFSSSSSSNFLFIFYIEFIIVKKGISKFKKHMFNITVDIQISFLIFFFVFCCQSLHHP